MTTAISRPSSATVETVLASGPATAKTIGIRLSLTTDAAGALVRRRIKKGDIRKAAIVGTTEQHYELTEQHATAAQTGASSHAACKAADVDRRRPRRAGTAAAAATPRAARVDEPRETFTRAMPEPRAALQQVLIAISEVDDAADLFRIALAINERRVALARKAKPK